MGRKCCFLEFDISIFQSFEIILFLWEMQNKEDDHGNSIFDPSQFLTTTQIKSDFSRLASA